MMLKSSDKIINYNYQENNKFLANMKNISINLRRIRKLMQMI